MNLLCSSLLVLLTASSTLASPTAVVGPTNGVLQGKPSGPAPAMVERDLKGRTTNLPGCNADNVLRALRSNVRTIAASSFCSTFLQSTTTITSTTVVPDTVVSTSVTTVSATETTVVDAVATTTIYCPAEPTNSVTQCNYPAYGYGAYLITSTAGVTPQACEQMCLANPDCKSYQTENGGNDYCNLYDVEAYGNVEYAPGDIYYISDRDCTTNENPICGATNPTFKVKRAVPIPTYLATVPASRISSACSCFITAADPQATVTSVVQETSTTLVMAGVTQTVPLTATTDVTSTVVMTASP